MCLHLLYDPRIGCEARVFRDPGFIILVTGWGGSDGGTVDKPTNHLHRLSPLLGSPRGDALPSFEPGAQWWIVTHLLSCSTKTH